VGLSPFVGRTWGGGERGGGRKFMSSCSRRKGSAKPSAIRALVELTSDAASRAEPRREGEEGGKGREGGRLPGIRIKAVAIRRTRYR